MNNERETAARPTASIVVRDSNGLGWEHLEATAYRCLRSNESCVVPSPQDSYLVKIQTSSSPVDLEWDYDGRQKARWAPGTMAFLPIGEPTQWNWGGPLESLIFEVRLEFWNRVALEIFGRDGAQSRLIPKFCPEDDALKQLLLLLAEEFYSATPNGPLYTEGLSLALATRLLRHHASQPMPAMRAPGALPRWKLQRIHEYIDANLGKRITLDDLASAAEVSSAYFARVFRRTAGIAPYQYVLRHRISRAIELITSSSLDLEEIAAITGFSSQSHFSTAFRKATQMTPKTFRHAHKTDRIISS